MERNGRETCKSKAERFLRRLLLLMTGLLLITVAGAALLADRRERAAEANEFTEIALLAATSNSTTELLATPAPVTLTEIPECPASPEPTMNEPNDQQILDRFTELFAQNSDLGGWVAIDGTNVNYPVMFTPENPEIYIHLSFSKKKSMSGVPFIGAGCTIQPRSDNIILYGHHMKNGTMFADIVKYKNKDFWREHPVIHFGTLYDEGDYAVFAVLATDLREAKTLRCYTFLNAKDEADFEDFLDGIRGAALYDTGIAVNYGDDLLTLSTCAYHTNDGRFVILAKRK